MGDSKKLSTSDDEDLEALRLAALRTIKKKNATLNGSLQSYHTPQRSAEKLKRFNRPLKGVHNKRGRFFGPHQGRNGKNGQFNNRNRNPNLISIPTMTSEEESVQEKATANDSGLIINLPQHRYCDGAIEVEKKQEETSKFNRYNKSDESESESEQEEDSPSEDDSPGKLHKADSLEALMQELDDEIHGKSKAKENLPIKNEKPKVKKIKKKKQSACERVSTSDSETKISNQIVEKQTNESNTEVIKHVESDVNADSEVKPQEIEKRSSEESGAENKPTFNDKFSPTRKRLRSRSPASRRNFPNRRRPRNFHNKFINASLQNMHFVAPLSAYPPPVHQFSNPPFNPLFAPPNIGIISQPPPFFERPLSPLAINAESLTTATLAPLSPRSAAFVLENKAIVERRKRSPRRSYSRSRSPSRSPRRSLTPRRLPRRSVSPRRLSRSPRRNSRSPRRKSLSPRRRSQSPRRRNASRTTESRAPVRDRLGLKGKTEEDKDNVRDTPSSPKKDEKPLDPVLEARKRKFESNEIKIREGIIRLKPKEDKLEENAVSTLTSATSDLRPVSLQVSTPKQVIVEEKKSELKREVSKEPDVIEELENLLKEDALLEGDDIELNSKVADIFSDEDSASDNEGRFKVKEGSNTKAPVLSFTKLMNGQKREIKAEPLPDYKRNERRRDRRDRIIKPRTSGRSPADRKEVAKENSKGEGERKHSPKKSESQDKSHTKSKISTKSDRHVTPMDRRFERKIEIKIKNPSKYERGSSKFKFTHQEMDEKLKEEAKRKIELDKETAEEEEPEIIIENNSGDDENSMISEGDLRAQLSKKRAEKLHRIPVEGISSRLLQNALQGAVFKKTKKKSKEQDITSSDGKLPIHLRLGIANSSDATKTKRKSRKRKNREVLEQV